MDWGSAVPFHINMPLSNELLSEPELPLSKMEISIVELFPRIWKEEKKFALRKKKFKSIHNTKPRKMSKGLGQASLGCGFRFIKCSGGPGHQWEQEPQKYGRTSQPRSHSLSGNSSIPNGAQSHSMEQGLDPRYWSRPARGQTLLTHPVMGLCQLCHVLRATLLPGDDPQYRMLWLPRLWAASSWES